jgi:hypothetical protein
MPEYGSYVTGALPEYDGTKSRVVALEQNNQQ